MTMRLLNRHKKKHNFLIKQSEGMVIVRLQQHYLVDGRAQNTDLRGITVFKINFSRNKDVRVIINAI